LKLGYIRQALAIGLMALSFVSCKHEGKIEMISAQQVYDAIYGSDSLQLLDVRVPEAYQVSHLKSAQNICVSNPDFKEKAALLDKSKPVYVYCKGGGESAEAAKILKKMGFVQVYDLQGGLTSWQKEALPMDPGTP